MTETSQISPRKKGGLLFTIIAVVAGLWLAWLVLVHSLSASLSIDYPRFALLLDSRNPVALLGAAQAILTDDAASRAGGDSPDRTTAGAIAAQDLIAKGVFYPLIKPQITPVERTELTALSIRALAAAPLNPAALRNLGLINPDDSASDEFMRRATALSMRESQAALWLAQRAYLRGDYAEASDYYDILLRVSPDLADFVVPTMARIAETPSGKREIERLLRTNPPWRWFFFNRLKYSVASPKTLTDLMIDMRANGVLIDPSDVNTALAWLVSRGETALAHEAWLALMPVGTKADSSLLNNAQLRHAPSGSPFDWTFGTGRGVDVEIVERPERPEERAIQAQFNPGMIDPTIARQLLVLAPGKYELRSEYTGRLETRRGVYWQVFCLTDTKPPLASSDAVFGSLSDWRTLSMTFTIPPSDCGSQVLRLSMKFFSDSDLIARGRILFAGISLTPAR